MGPWIYFTFKLSVMDDDGYDRCRSCDAIIGTQAETSQRARLGRGSSSPLGGTYPRRSNWRVERARRDPSVTLRCVPSTSATAIFYCLKVAREIVSVEVMFPHVLSSGITSVAGEQLNAVRTRATSPLTSPSLPKACSRLHSPQ